MNCRSYSTAPPGRTSWWRKLAPAGLMFALLGVFGAKEARATTCAGATVLTYQNYPAFSITCGAGNDINSGNATACGSTSYLGGQEALYTFTSLGTGAATFAYVGVSWTGIQLWAGCPTSGGTCVASITSSATSKTLNANLVNGTTYYLMVDTWPTPNSPCPGTLAITVPAPAAPCAGAPTGGTSSPASASVCSNTPVTLTVSGQTAATGITLAWQESDDNGVVDPWAPAVGGTGATTTTYTTPGYSGVRYYRCLVTCTNSGLSTPSSTSIVTQTGNCQFTVARNTGISYQTIVGNGGVPYTFQFGTTSTDDASTNPVSLAGTTFQYKGQPVTGFVACTNGWMSFNTATTNADYLNNLGSTSTGLRAMLAPFWDDLVCTGNPFTSAGQNASMQYKIVGTLGSGSAQIIAEWIGMEKFSNPGPNLNFQVILNEAGNTITYRYGTMVGFDGGTNTLWDTSIGLNGWTFTAPTSFSDVMALRDENTTNFDYTPATVSNAGLNYKVTTPDCFSELVFTPAPAYPGPGPAPTAPPVNDDLGGAITLSVGTLPCTDYCGTFYSSRTATASAGIPVCSAGVPGTPDDDVWFSFVPLQANTNITVRGGAAMDPVVQVLDATGTTALYCVNATGAGLLETVNATGLTVGQTYRIRVYHAGVGVPTAGRNDFSICVFNAPPPPANDDCAGAISIPVGLTCSYTAGTSLTATGSAQPLCTGTPDDDVWYSFVAVGNAATVTVQSVGSYNAAYQVFSSSTNDCNNLTSIFCLNNTSTGGIETGVVPGLTAGNTYFVRVYHAAAGAANGSFNICVTAGPLCPTLSSPANGGTVVTLPFNLSWTAGQFASGYDVYFDASPTPSTLVSSNQPGVTYTVNGPLANGLYYWTVVSRNILGVATGCTTFAVNVNIPSCQQPGAVTVTPGVNDATVNWGCFGCLGTYIVEYGAPGFIPGTGASAGAGTVVTSATTSALLSGLTSGQQYQVYVRQECNPGVEYSLNTGPINFTTNLGCGGTYRDVGGLGAYPAGLNNAPDIRTICPTNPGDKVIMTFSEFRTEASWDPLYVFNGTSTTAPKIASANGAPVTTPNLGTGGWWSDVTPSTSAGAIANAPTNIGIPGTVLATNPSGCLTFAHISDGSFQFEGFTASISCVTPQYSCATAQPIACGEIKSGFTIGGTNTLPPTACDYNGGSSTSGVSWWTFTGGAFDQDVTMTTCGATTMNTRISIFKANPDCSNLVCVGGVDDGPGCPNGSTETKFLAQAGQLYYVAVHGNAANDGTFQLTALCTPNCVVPNNNDACANAVALTTYLQDGSQVLFSDDNSCAYVEGAVSCTGSGPAVGNWYTFNTGPNAKHRLYTVDNNVAPYTATTVNYALYSGTCSNLIATGQVACGSDVGGSFVQFPDLALNSDYKLLIYNNGSTSQYGTYALWVDHPAAYDAQVVSVNSPTGLICNENVQPVIVLQNNGEQTLTAVTLEVSVDGNPPFASFNWTGSLAQGASTAYTMPFVTIPTGFHTLTVTTKNPNGLPDQIPANDGAGSTYDLTGQSLTVSVNADANAGQISWAVYDPFFFPVASSGPLTPNAPNETTTCLATTFGNCFYFFLFDAAGDGLLSPGRWELRDGAQRTILRDNGQYGNQSPALSPASPSYFAHEFCLPLGPSAPLQTECELYSNLLSNKVFCNTVAGVTNYQFEFLDPNAGFRRRIAVPRNWVQFSEMQTNPLAFGTTYFAHVRADVGNDGFFNDFYGAGCEMALAAVQPICTELISNPGPSLSCGVTKTFGGSDKIYAVPVLGATQYRFRFTGGLIDPDGPTGPTAPSVQARNIIRTSYVNPLNWATFTLVSGQTYTVQVEAYVSGNWTGYCGATCTVSILNPPAFGGREVETTVAVENGTGVSLWPNPVRDGRVNLRIEGLSGELQPIEVEVYDMFGKRVMSKHFETEASLFNQTLELNNELAAGIYLVQITVAGEQSVQRLNVVR